MFSDGWRGLCYVREKHKDNYILYMHFIFLGNNRVQRKRKQSTKIWSRLEFFRGVFVPFLHFAHCFASEYSFSSTFIILSLKIRFGSAPFTQKAALALLWRWRGNPFSKRLACVEITSFLPSLSRRRFLFHCVLLAIRIQCYRTRQVCQLENLEIKGQWFFCWYPWCGLNGSVVIIAEEREVD